MGHKNLFADRKMTLFGKKFADPAWKTGRADFFCA